MVVDARGLECPKPVLKTKDAVDAKIQGFSVLVSSEVSLENVKKFLTKSGYSFDVSDHPDGYHIKAQKSGEAVADEPLACDVSANLIDKILLIKNDYIGGDEELGRKLLSGFLAALTKTDKRPKKIFFINHGVMVTTDETLVDVLNSLRALSELGVEIKSCGMCLEYFDLIDALKVGSVGNALETVEGMMEFGVVSL